MGFLQNLRQLFSTTTEKPEISASGYDAGSNGRRAQGWNASRLGPNTLLVQNLEQLRARSREAVRNSGIARSACDHFESNVIGENGITPHFMHPDRDIRMALQKSWDKWKKKCDFNGQLGFSGIQSLIARELFEAGEVFVRFHIDFDEGFQLQLIEGEQCPVFQNFALENNQVAKAGIVFNDKDRRIGYQIYRQNPYDFVMGSYSSTTEMLFIPVDEMLQILRPLRAGQVRGEPTMTPVLTLLKDLEDFSDSERLRKKIGAMFAAFIEKPGSDDQQMIPKPAYTPSVGDDVANGGSLSLGEMQPGSIQELLPGEKISFPQIPETGDYTTFIKTELHKFAAGVGLTYEALTGDLDGVSYSSIRAGMLEFRRSIEMFQRNIIIQQFCDPTLKRWMKEAVLSGDLELPFDYYEDPTDYEDVAWVTSGWQWIDPAKEMAAFQTAVRSGFTSRSMVLRELGLDPEVIDSQQAIERQRAKDLGLIYDSDPNQTINKGFSEPLKDTVANPNPDTDDVADLEDE